MIGDCQVQAETLLDIGAGVGILHHELLAKLGPEPLTAAFDGERLFQQSRGRSMAVKPFIMDNAVVVGVGNIYATEALFAAGIDPRREAGGILREPRAVKELAIE